MDPPDYKRLKGNFRCALHKSTDFEEVKDEESMNRQTGNYKKFRLLSPDEVKGKLLKACYVLTSVTTFCNQLAWMRGSVRKLPHGVFTDSYRIEQTIRKSILCCKSTHICQKWVKACCYYERAAGWERVIYMQDSCNVCLHFAEARLGANYCVPNETGPEARFSAALCLA